MKVEIAEGIYWVGVTDWDLRRFHGHELSTPRGSAYNAYLVVDEKVALVDTVWDPFTDRLIENLAEVVDLGRIDYVVVNHAEADHSGALPEVMRRCPKAEIIVSRRGAESVAGHFRQGWKTRPVGTGERLALGRRELLFIEAPMLHWPDSMFTYVTGSRVLMSNDAFGQHYATAFRFNDQVDQGELYWEALKYYANILLPFSPAVTKKIQELTALQLPVDLIAPSHGVLWRRDPLQIVNRYAEWAEQRPQPRAVVVYDTMWNGTRRMAEAIGEGLAQTGAAHLLRHVAVSDRSDLLAEIFQAKVVLAGSPTHNNGPLPTLWPFLHDLKNLKFRHKRAAAFGCYGWSGEAVKVIEEHFAGCGFPLVAEGVRAKWRPTAGDLEACRALGRKAGEAAQAAD